MNNYLVGGFTLQSCCTSQQAWASEGKC